MTEQDEIMAGLEAILMIADSPVSVAELAAALETDPAEIAALLEALAAEYRGEGGDGELFRRPRGFELRQVGEGWRIYVATRYQSLVQRFVTMGSTGRLSQAALETLAVVAYKQPCTRAQVAAIRGVNVDSVMRNLAARGLIEECGQTNLGALLYRTTPAFLEQTGMDSLDQLPPLAPYVPANPDLTPVLAAETAEAILDAQTQEATPAFQTEEEEEETHE